MKKELKNYFIPHKENNYRPSSLQSFAMVGMMMLVVLSFAVANIQSLIWISSDWLVSTILPSVIVELTNEERVDSSLSSLHRNTLLDAAAQLKAAHMAEYEYFSHYSPDGVSPWYWFNEVSYNFVHAGENLAIHFTDSDMVVEAWMDSPSHRANILNENFSEIGVGAAQGYYNGHETVYVVQLFGTPAFVADTQTVEPAAIAEEETDEDPVLALAEEESPLIAGSQGSQEEVEEGEVTVSSDREPVTVSPVPEPAYSDPVPTGVAEISEDIPETEVVDIAVEDDTVSLYSDFVSTSTGGIPASLDSGDTTNAGATPTIATLATRPIRTLEIAYMAIGSIVFISLLLSIFIEIRRQQPLQIAYGTGLMAAMMLLFFLHAYIMQTVVIA